jgi:hypothetical protein
VVINSQVDGNIETFDFNFGYNFIFREQPDYRINPITKSLGVNEPYSTAWRDTYRFWSVMDENSFNGNLKKDLGKDLDGIYGEWLNNPGYKDFGGESVNLTKLKEAMGKQKITKENLEKAAMETVTGKWAASKGFTKAKVVSDKKVYKGLDNNINKLNELEVIFVK